jgi:hypothetical protein
MARKLKPDPHYRKNLIRRAASLPTRDRAPLTPEQIARERQAREDRMVLAYVEEGLGG